MILAGIFFVAAVVTTVKSEDTAYSAEVIRTLDGVQQKLATLPFKSQAHGRNVQSLLEEIKNQAKGLNKNEIQVLGRSSKALSANMENVLSDDPLDVVVGILDAVSTVSQATGVGSAVVPQVVSVVTAIIGMVQNKPTVTEVVDKLIENRLAKQRSEDLMDNVRGAKRWIIGSQNFMSGMIGMNLTMLDITNLNSHVPFYQGLEVLGEVGSHIMRLSEDTNKESDARNAIQLIRLYTELSVMRELMLVTLQSFNARLTQSQATAAGLGIALIGGREQEKHILSFLRRPKAKHANLIFYYNTTEERIVESRLNTISAPRQAASDLSARKCYQISPKSDKDWKLCNIDNEVVATKRTDIECKFRVTRSANGAFIIYQPSTLRRWSIFMYTNPKSVCHYDMSFEVCGEVAHGHIVITKIAHGEDDEFNIVRFEDGTAFIRPTKEPKHLPQLSSRSIFTLFKEKDVTIYKEVNEFDPELLFHIDEVHC